MISMDVFVNLDMGIGIVFNPYVVSVIYYTVDVSIDIVGIYPVYLVKRNKKIRIYMIDYVYVFNVVDISIC